ncbi:MAG: acetyl-CoA carboxylase biotin carboxyl carrier protein [Candidatus Zixiibacteriota bacterium]
MNIEKIKQLIFLAEEHDLSEIEVQLSWRKKIRIVRAGKNQAPQVNLPMNPADNLKQPAAKQEVKDDAEEKEDNNYIEITAPIVGTLYRKPSPDDEPYIVVGDMVEKGKVVCLIEAMKIFNEIKSEVSGKIVKVLVEDGEPVEYGHTLFLVDPNS